MVEESAAACVTGNLLQALEKAKEAVSDAPSNRVLLVTLCGNITSLLVEGLEYIWFTSVVRCVRNEQLG